MSLVVRAEFEQSNASCNLPCLSAVTADTPCSGISDWSADGIEEHAGQNGAGEPKKSSKNDCDQVQMGNIFMIDETLKVGRKKTAMPIFGLLACLCPGSLFITTEWMLHACQ